MLRWQPISSLGLLAALAAGGCGTNATAITDPDQIPADVGVLEGEVHFIGVPCQPTHLTRPPCDGPYPDYEVIIYRSDGRTEAARPRSDESGHYRAELAAGSYVIFTQAGFRSDMRQRYEVSVREGERTTQDLVVDTGVR